MTNIKELFQNFTKPITSLKIIMYTRLALGTYFDISKSKIVCLFIRIYCISLCAFSTSVYHTHYKSTAYIPYLVGSIIYIFNVVLSLCTAEKYFLKFCDAIKTGDALMNYKNIPLISPYINAIFYVIILLRLCISLLYMKVFEISFLIATSPVIIFLSVGLNNMTVQIIFSLLHTRMRMLRKSLENNHISVSAIGINEESQINRIRNTRKCLLNYNHLLDNLMTIENYIQWLLLAAFIINVPANIMYSYYALKEYYGPTNGWYIFNNIYEAVGTILVMSSPGIIAELIIKEVDKIKTTLTKQLMECTDESLRLELDIFLMFVRWRPFKFLIAGAVPLDGGLPLKMAALCVTYVIVIVQFNHFH